MSYSYKDAKVNYDDYMLNYLRMTGYYTGRFFKCRNPEHYDNNPSMSFNPKKNKVHCFSCGCTYDLIELVKVDNNFSYAEAVNFIRDKFTNEKPLKINVSESKTNYLNYYLSCDADYSYLKSRGINEYLAYKFGTRWDSNHKSVIISNGHYSYTERFTEGNLRYKHFGELILYNKTQPVNQDKPTIIVEGEIDCLSVYEALGFKEGINIKDLEYNCIALGSANNWYRLIESGINNLILALDNDESGLNATRLLSIELSKLNITFKVVNLYDKYKDANEILLNDKELFIQNIKKI